MVHCDSEEEAEVKFHTFQHNAHGDDVIATCETCGREWELQIPKGPRVEVACQSWRCRERGSYVVEEFKRTAVTKCLRGNRKATNALQIEAAQLLRTTREAAGYTRESLASKAGVTFGSIKGCENDNYAMHPETAAKISAVLDIPRLVEIAKILQAEWAAAQVLVARALEEYARENQISITRLRWEIGVTGKEFLRRHLDRLEDDHGLNLKHLLPDWANERLRKTK